MNTQTPGQPLLPRALASPVAAFVAFAAGQVWADGESWRLVVDQMGIKLPWITEVVYRSPTSVMVALLLVAAGILACADLGAPQRWSAKRARSLRLLSQTGAALALCLAGLALAAYYLPFAEFQGTLQQ
tara:strand:- start:2 stop:388 length:387 start_codon:yes stop_codon:yes gene_type:complete